jgi:tetratricopeptide (TPR) repeat protein
MTPGRSSINLIFALIVAALASTTAISILRRSPGPESRSLPADRQPLPENHPPVDIEEKVAALQQMAARDPRNPEHLTRIGNLYYDMGKYEDAVQFYQRSLDIRPRDPNVQTDMANCYHYLGRHDKSLSLLDDVLAYNPGFSQAKYNKGVVLMEGKKDVRAAISVWEDLLRTDPGYGRRAELESKIRELKSSLR